MNGPASLLAGELRATLGLLARRLREQTEGSDLTKSQSAVLLLVEQAGAATATGLAEAAGMRPQSMAKIIHALEEAGLVTGSPDPADGRKTLISLSRAAREQFRTGRRAKQDWLTQAIEHTLTAGEIQRLASSTGLLRRLAQAP
ncbi:MarR family winged helix-turn-helix transcriptional regulator [Amycolatopsis sp.]|uniref:MarR family winged helix-turn-helix transcriptional regulator n=1 Tax=Amycolatopsis sp. TaxID=37632 RepID=UPI002C0DF5FF|nr:MarR family transcriptional regulator [Amycolatopsis sp.]HVV11483.1 MarR family transcriptional regulator [Amycolatopsis sp.]